MKNINFIQFKVIVFFIFIIPYLMHIYSYVISMLYMNNIIIIVSLIILSSLFIFYYTNVIFKFDKDILYFIPYLFSILLLDIYYGTYEVFKNTAYVFILFYILNILYSKKIYFLFFINFIIYSFYILFIIYIITFIFNLRYDYLISELNYIPEIIKQMFSNRQNHSLIFYILPFEVDISKNSYSIFGITRFYGFSYEPTVYAAIILPTFYMAIYLDKKVKAFILLFMLFLISSYKSLVYLILFSVFLFIKKKNILINVLIIFLIFIVLFYIFIPFVDIGYFNIPRIDNYYGIFLGRSKLYYDILFPSNLEFFLLLLRKLSYFIILFYLYKKILQSEQLNILIAFLLSLVFLLGKDIGIITPLFTFYISFILYVSNNRLRSL